MKEKIIQEQELWRKINLLREEMIKIATRKNLDLLDKEVLSLNQQLNNLLNEYEKLLHEKQTPSNP
jgi:predicted  nucleic acid-binding Zn-ribbon protein